MNKRSFGIIKITPKSILVTIIVLVLVDVLVRYYWAGMYAHPGNVRLANEEVATLRSMQEQIKDAEGYKILFLGDSQTYGSAVKRPDQTIPAYVEKELRSRYPERKIKVFNYAFKGYGPVENYFLLNSLADADLDLVVYNVSTSWFQRAKTLEHPNVVKLSQKYYRGDLVQRAGVPTQKQFKDRVSDQLDQWVGRGWSLYQNRSTIATWIFDQSLRQIIENSYQGLARPNQLAKKQLEERQLYQPWQEKNWREILGAKPQQFGQVKLAPVNPQLQFYQLMLGLLEEQKIAGQFYISPQNIALLRKHYNFDQGAYQASRGKLEKITQKGQVSMRDYSHLIDDRYFTDTIHLNERGNYLVAKQLVQDLAPRLEVTDR